MVNIIIKMHFDQIQIFSQNRNYDDYDLGH